MTRAARAIRRETNLGLTQAVHRNRAFSKAGVSERLFTAAFSGLVYPQIWEDPVVDMAALRLRPEDHVVTIASGVATRSPTSRPTRHGSAPSTSTARMWHWEG